MSEIYLTNDDVVSTDTSNSSNFGLGTTFKLSELMKVVINLLIGANSSYSPYTSWLKPDGVPCQVLRTDGRGWQSGKVRFRVEFIPDSPDVEKPQTGIRYTLAPSESPLDDLRTDLKV